MARFWTLSKHLQEPGSVPYYATNTHTHTAERENTVRRECVISLIPSVLKGFFFFPLHADTLQNNHYWPGEDAGILWCVGGPEHHTQSRPTSLGEYNYETFKPPLRSHISMSTPLLLLLLFFFLPVQTGKEEILTTPTGLCVGFFFFHPSPTFGMGCVVVACLSHFSVWSRASPHRQILEQCSEGRHTHIYLKKKIKLQDPSRWSESLTHAQQQICCVFSFLRFVFLSKKLAERKYTRQTDTHTHSGWLREATDFSPPPSIQTDRETNTKDSNTAVYSRTIGLKARVEVVNKTKNKKNPNVAVRLASHGGSERQPLCFAMWQSDEAPITGCLRSWCCLMLIKNTHTHTHLKNNNSQRLKIHLFAEEASWTSAKPIQHIAPVNTECEWTQQRTGSFLIQI